MPNLKVKKLSVGDLQVNCFIVHNYSECLIVDPGGDIETIVDFINSKNLGVEGIILTHGHFDHFVVAEELSSKYNVKIYAHEDDHKLLLDPKMNLSSYFYQNNPIKINNPSILESLGDNISFNVAKFVVIHVPGHSPGSVCLYNKENQFCIAGDVLFKMSIGRTDFPYCNQNQLVEGIKKKLLILPDNTVIYPGHGDKTTIKEEKKFNPHL